MTREEIVNFERQLYQQSVLDAQMQSAQESEEIRREQAEKDARIKAERKMIEAEVAKNRARIAEEKKKDAAEAERKEIERVYFEVNPGADSIDFKHDFAKLTERLRIERALRALLSNETGNRLDMSQFS